MRYTGRSDFASKCISKYASLRLSGMCSLRETAVVEDLVNTGELQQVEGEIFDARRDWLFRYVYYRCSHGQGKSEHCGINLMRIHIDTCVEKQCGNFWLPDGQE